MLILMCPCLENEAVAVKGRVQATSEALAMRVLHKE